MSENYWLGAAISATIYLNVLWWAAVLSSFDYVFVFGVALITGFILTFPSWICYFWLHCRTRIEAEGEGEE